MIPNGRVAVIANDAGGAELISSWLIHNSISYTLSLAGPAKNIFERKIDKVSNDSLKSAIDKSDWVLTGTGWSSKLELNAIIYALSIKKYVVSMIDHWVNYKERFVDDLKIYLPNEIWVTDEPAYNKAKPIFMGTKVRLIKNYFMQDLLLEIINYKEKYHSSSVTNILYICEPIRADWGNKNEEGEFQAMRYFFNNLKKISILNEPKFFLRLHPSEDYNKYDKFLKNNFPDLKVNKIKNIPLSKQIAESDIIVGSQSYALAIAVNAKKMVYSILPPWAPKCVIPHKEIKHLKDFV